VAGVIQATGKMIGNGIIQACRVPGETGLFGAVVAICESRGAEIDTGDGNDALFSGSSCRVLAAVQPGKAADAAAVCRKYGLQSAAAGKVTGNDRLVARSCGSVVCDLPVSLFAEKSLICGFAPEAYDAQKPFAKPAGSLKDLALKVLSHPELADGSLNSAQFNTQAQGRTYTITPFYSVLELDGLGCSLVCGGNARHMYLNPYAGGANTILELASHLASVGGTPLCALGTLNFGSPESLWQAEEAVKGMEDMCRALHVPSVSGTVSFRPGKNPAPAVSMLGRGDLIGWEWPDNNDMIAVVGVTQDDLGGSVLDAVTGCGGKAPEAGDIRAVPVIRDLVEKALVSGCMAVTRGGLLYALVNLAAQADVAIAGDPLMKLFSETCGRFLVTFSDEYHLKESGLPYEVIGRITAGGKLVIRTETEEVVLTQQELFTAGSTLTRACRAQ
jgi:phosphoribosylformylglycinamidine synthase